MTDHLVHPMWREATPLPGQAPAGDQRNPTGTSQQMANPLSGPHPRFGDSSGRPGQGPPNRPRQRGATWVTTPPLQSPGIWLLKSALKGVDFVPQDLEDPVGRANYSSVNDFVSQARATFMEEVDLGMVEGGRSPNNKQPRDANANLKIYARIIGSHCSH